MDEATYRWIIQGRVQGVGYRYFALQAALHLGLRGTVRNLEDGTVEVLVSGPAPVVATLKARLDEGPQWAEVLGVAETEIDASSLPASFEVLF